MSERKLEKLVALNTILKIQKRAPGILKWKFSRGKCFRCTCTALKEFFTCKSYAVLRFDPLSGF